MAEYCRLEMNNVRTWFPVANIDVRPPILIAVRNRSHNFKFA